MGTSATELCRPSTLRPAIEAPHRMVRRSGPSLREGLGTGSKGRCPFDYWECAAGLSCCGTRRRDRPGDTAGLSGPGRCIPWPERQHISHTKKGNRRPGRCAGLAQDDRSALNCLYSRHERKCNEGTEVPSFVGIWIWIPSMR